MGLFPELMTFTSPGRLTTSLPGPPRVREAAVTCLPQPKCGRWWGVVLVAGLLLLSTGCGAPDGGSTAEERRSARAAELGFETGVDPELAKASPGQCMDAWSLAASYDTAELVEDCSSPDAFLRITSVGAPCTDGDYGAVVTDDETPVCGRLNVDVHAPCSVEKPCQVHTVTAVESAR